MGQSQRDCITLKILTNQGSHAPGGKYGYVINGHMIGGFAQVAWPAESGNSDTLPMRH